MSKSETKVTKPSGVRELRSALEWYRNGESRGSEGIPIQISGVWDLLCGRKPKVNGEIQHESLTDLAEHLANNRNQFTDHDELSLSDINRVVGLLRALSDVESEHRVYREDREHKGRFDYRVQCWVGLHHITEKTTIVTYLHKSPGMGMTVYSNTGVASPRRDVGEYLHNDVFYNKYDYARIE